MPPGFPPAAAAPPTREPAAGPTEALAVGGTGLIAPPGVVTPLTFLPSAGSEMDPVRWRGAWEDWVADMFASVLAPALVEMADLAARERVRELRAADQALAGRLAPEVSRRLAGAGRILLTDLHGARSTRWLGRFEAWAAGGETPALFPTVFAARAALFHLPPRPMLAGYAGLEWRAVAGSEMVAPTDALASVAGRLLHPAFPMVAA